MIWFLLQKIGFFIFLLLTIYFAFRRKYESLLILYFFGMTFATCYVFAFTIWLPIKIIAMAMVVCLLYEPQKRYNQAFRVIYPLASFFIIAIMISDLIGIAISGPYAPQINKYMRLINSNYSYLTTIGILFMGIIMNKGFAKRLYPYYCLAVEVAIAFGLIHFICLKVGVGFMPILRQDGSVNIEALAQMGGKVVSRIYGVSGEPKNLGFLICPYLLSSILMFGQGVYRVNKRYHIATLLAGTFILINTFSSSALINFFLALPLVMIFLPSPRITYKAAAIIGSLCIVACFWYLNNETNLSKINARESEGSFIEQLYERTFGRAQNEMENDRQESVILGYMASEKNVITMIFGWGISQYTFHVPGQAIGKSLIPVQSGLVLTLADFGLIGFLLILAICYVILKILILSLKNQNTYAQAFSVMALSAFIGSLMFGSITTCFIYLMLALYAYYDELEMYEITSNKQ